MSAGIRLEDLTLSYERHPAVHHVSGTFKPGSLTAVTGPNGAGKSTLLKGIAGIIPPSEGRIVFEGITSSGVAFLPQLVEIQRDFPINVLQMVSTGCWHPTGSFKSIRQPLKQKALEALETVGLRGFASRQIGTLSAGQFQRLMFARLLLQDAQVILLDEPFIAVDSETASRLMDIILRWHKERRTVICVLHNVEQIRKYFPECLLLARECVIWGPSAEALKPDHLINTMMFREAWQPQAEVCEQ